MAVCPISEADFLFLVLNFAGFKGDKLVDLQLGVAELPRLANGSNNFVKWMMAKTVCFSVVVVSPAATSSLKQQTLDMG
jgi:hypothetical protein